MPRVKDGKLILTGKERRFYENYLATGNAMDAARLAGYSENSVKVISWRLSRKMREFPSEFWRDCLIQQGVTPPYMAAQLRKILDRDGEKGDKNRLLAIQVGLSGWGVASTSKESDKNTFNIQGPVMVIQGEETRRKALREGTPQVEEDELRPHQGV